MVPEGRVLVAPADGYVLYVRRIENGVIPYVDKKGVSIPMVDHLKTGADYPDFNGWLIGIFMGTFDVHINRVPISGSLVRQTIFNGPHMNMTKAELEIMATNLIPGAVTFNKLLGQEPYAIETKADFILKSARETLEFRDSRDKRIYVTRIADYWVGKILTWIKPGQQLTTGERIGMISWGSQTDLFIENSESLEILITPGEHTLAGETVIGRY